MTANEPDREVAGDRDWSGGYRDERVIEAGPRRWLARRSRMAALVAGAVAMAVGGLWLVSNADDDGNLRPASDVGDSRLPLELVAVRLQGSGIALVDLHDERLITSLVSDLPADIQPVGAAGITDDGSVLLADTEVVVYRDDLSRPRIYEPGVPVEVDPALATDPWLVPLPDAPLVWIVWGNQRTSPVLALLFDPEDGATIDSLRLDADAYPVGATNEGLIVNTVEPRDMESGEVLYAKRNGDVVSLGPGKALVATQSHVAVLRCEEGDDGGDGDCDLHVVDLDTGESSAVAQPVEGRWQTVRSPPFPTQSVRSWPDVSESGRILLGINPETTSPANDADPGTGHLVAVDPAEPTATEVLATLDHPVEQAAWGGDERTLAIITYTAYNVEITARDLATDSTSVSSQSVIPDGYMVIAGRWLTGEGDHP